MRRDAKKAARIAPGIYLCSVCGKGHKEIEIDHCISVGKTPGSKGATTDWNGFMSRLFCSSDGLQALCRQCHSAKRVK